MSNIAKFVICQKPYKCRICYETFESSSDFVDHLFRKHYPEMKITLWNKCQISQEVREINDGASW